jgi:hypothetical protein
MGIGSFRAFVATVLGRFGSSRASIVRTIKSPPSKALGPSCTVAAGLTRVVIRAK